VKRRAKPADEDRVDGEPLTAVQQALVRILVPIFVAEILADTAERPSSSDVGESVGLTQPDAAALPGPRRVKA